MKIHYKFNKSSEARDCVVESVELIIYEIDSNNITSENCLKAIPRIRYFDNQQLKDYINTIQESIEFIAESSIDDVLMKEWLGEWEYELYCKHCKSYLVNELCEASAQNYIEVPNCKADYCATGSPKLSSNWTFKIN